jgi:phosphinothricin acetyltransferase
MSALGARIRVATVADAPRLIEIYGKYCRSNGTTAEFEAPSVADFESRIRDTLAFWPYLVIEDPTSGLVLGYAYGSVWQPFPVFQWIVSTAIYIDGKSRGRGFGTKLYERLIAALTDQHFVEISAGLCLPNETSIRFHKKFGFERRATLSPLTFKSGWHPGEYWGRTINERKNPPDTLIPFGDLDHTKYIGMV